MFKKTLFVLAAEDNALFAAVLEKYFDGRRCKRTLNMISGKGEYQRKMPRSKREKNTFAPPVQPTEPIKNPFVDDRIFSDEIMLFGNEEKR